MLLYLSREQYEYDLRGLLMSFFPGAEIEKVLEPLSLDTGEPAFSVVFAEEDGEETRVRYTEAGPATFSKSACLPLSARPRKKRPALNRRSTVSFQKRPGKCFPGGL